MKRRVLFAALVAGFAVNALSLTAQESFLPAQNVVPVPAVLAKPVTTAENYLNPLHQEEWVVLDSSGAVHGSFSTFGEDGTTRGISGATMVVSRNGTPLQTVTSSSDGHFEFSGLGVGTYGLVGRSDSSVAAFALHVLPSGASNRLDSDFTVFGTTMGGAAIESVLRAHSVPGVGSAAYPQLQTDPVGEARIFNESSRVQLRSGGQLVGRVSKPSGFNSDDLSGNVVHIFRAGVVVGHEPTNARGEFQVSGMTPGVYDVVVAGKDGIAAGSFQALAAGGTAQKGRDGSKLVSANQPIPDALNVELIPSTDYYIVEEDEEILPIIGDEGFGPIPGGGFVGPGGFAGGGGGFGGGGGGFGGGGGGGGLGRLGGIGGLLGVAGLAAGVAALANEDDGFNLPPASLIVP